MSASSSASCGAMSFRPSGPASRPTPIPRMTGLVDHRLRGNSVLLLTCLRTGSRRRIAAGRPLRAAAADRIVSAHQELALAQHGFAHESREVIVQRVAVGLQDPALPALARIENSSILTARKSRAQSCPAAAPEAGHCPVRLGAAAQLLDQRVELADRSGALGGGLDA